MCGRSPDNHHAIAIAAPLPPPPSVVVVEMAPHGHRPGKEEAEYNEEEEDDREFEEEFLRFSMMEGEEDDDDDDDDGEEIIAVVSPPRRPLVGARGTPSAVEFVTNLPVATETGGDGTKASKRRRGSAKPPVAKKARSKHGFHGVHRRTYGRWAAEIRDTVIKGTRVWIGTFDTAEAAALAYDAAARRIFGGNARTNFPDDGGDRPPLPPPSLPPAAKPCSSSKSKRPTKKRNTGNGTTTSRRRRRGDQEDAAAATTPPQAVVATGNSDDTPAPGASVELISLCTAAAQALELTDGWEFEPFIQELLLGGGVEPLDYFNGQELVGAAAGDLWSF